MPSTLMLEPEDLLIAFCHGQGLDEPTPEMETLVFALSPADGKRIAAEVQRISREYHLYWMTALESLLAF